MYKRILLPLLLLTIWPATQASAARPAWPSLAQQLAKDRVEPGSALAKLIAANQDFDKKLRPEEADDLIPVPPWLRVYFRKQHPDFEARPGDPTGGYPFVLKEVHEWMVHHQDLRPGDPEGGESAYEKSEEDKGVESGPDQRISGLQTSARSETDIRVNYWDPSRIVAASNNIRGGGALGIYYSGDAGATWGQTLLPRTGNFGDDFHSDPTVDWTSDGTAWAVTIGINSEPINLQLRAYKSTDGGATWTYDATISGDHQFADRQMIWVDHSASSPYKDNLYVVWHNGPNVFMARRTAADGVWHAPIQVSGRETMGTGIGSDVKVDGAGTVYAYWPDTGSQRIYVVKSTNGGASYSKPVAVAKTFGWFTIGVPAQNGRRTAIYVTSGAYRAGKQSLVYAAWHDLEGSKGCNSWTQEPRDNVNSPCKTRIWFSRSTNGGLKWSKPRMIYNQKTLNDQFHPWMVVDEATGALAIMYYDTTGEERNKVNVWFQASYDKGVTWSAPFRVTTAPSSTTDEGGDGNQYGDYNGMSGIAGTFFPVWTDRRELTFQDREEVWTAALVARKNLACKSTDLFVHGLGTGVANVAVPGGATQASLSFWHRRSGEGGGTLKIALDGGAPVPVPAWAITSGARYTRGQVVDDSPVNTVVDLDAVCNSLTGESNGCGGRSLSLYFSAGDRGGWSLDDAALTACTQ
ncbi:MAG TPA: sialidase family protein [Thermoanaerobaculia bacterium]|nr:sialidase family protein [Thermoanaerobaculia bacterium]